MELDMRKRIILQLIIEDYIETAMPVGSRTIAKHEGVKYSSATIRNEMSDLEEMGYLLQPHTSAGRIPSAKAYRIYVDEMIHGYENRISKEQLEAIRSYAHAELKGSSDLIKQTAKVLTEITQYPSMVIGPVWEKLKLKRIQFVPVLEKKVLCVIVAENGVVHDRLLNVRRAIGPKECEEYSRILSQRLAGKGLKAGAEVLQKEMLRIGEEHNFLAEVAMLLEEEAREEPKASNMELSGVTKLLTHPEYNDIVKAREMLSILEEKEKLFEAFPAPLNMELSISIGPENEMAGLRESSFISTSYRVGKSGEGFFGIIGPTRMDYRRVMNMLNLLVPCIEEIFNAAETGEGE